MARTLGISFEQVLAMPNYVFQLWVAFLSPDPEPDTSYLEGICD